MLATEKTFGFLKAAIAVRLILSSLASAGAIADVVQAATWRPHQTPQTQPVQSPAGRPRLEVIHLHRVAPAR